MSSRLSFSQPPLMIMDGGVDTGCQQQDNPPTWRTFGNSACRKGRAAVDVAAEFRDVLAPALRVMR